MNKFTKKDLILSIIAGLITGAIGWRILVFLNKDVLFGVPLSYLVIIIPILWITGVNLGYFLGRFIPFFNQFGRFAAIGFTNFAVYSGVLNLLIAHTNITSGRWYSTFVAIAFVVGSIHSYIWNKYWVFDSAESGGGTIEFSKFFTVSVIAGLINVVIASSIVNYVNPMFEITPEGWANVGGIVGSASALIFSFAGYRMLVFKNKPDAISKI